MPIKQETERITALIPIEVGIKPLQGLTRPSFIERLAALPPSISSSGLMEHACHSELKAKSIYPSLTREFTGLSPAQDDKSEDQLSLQASIPSADEKGSQRLTSFPRMHRGSGRSRRRCSSCQESEKSGHQCKAKGAPKSQQSMPGTSSIGNLPSKKSGLY